jgi:hypothetical protein
MTEREDVIETVEMQTVAVTTPASVEPVGTDLGKVRELVLKAHPDVVPDLVRGSSVDELIASVEPARSAYQRIAEQVQGRTESEVGGRRSDVTSDSRPPTSDSAVVQPPPVPAGGAATVVDPADLTPTSKIARALAARQRT